eukprot:jgi/Mesen1/5010/ME000025S04404
MMEEEELLCETSTSGRQPPTLVAICIAYLGSFLEELIEDAHLFGPALPTSVKLSLAAVARRRGLLCDQLLYALLDDSWRVLDVSGSLVTDEGIRRAADKCPLLEAVDLSRCQGVTSASLQHLVRVCSSLRTLRVGRSAASDVAARSALKSIMPRLAGRGDHAAPVDDWESVDVDRVGAGAQALRWLVWPTVDERSANLLEAECPKVALNAKQTAARPVPLEAREGVDLDAAFVEGVNPATWAVQLDLQHTLYEGGREGGKHSDVPLAERFRLAYIARDARLAPKREKNRRRKERKAERAWVEGDIDARARRLSEAVLKSLKIDKKYS